MRRDECRVRSFFEDCWRQKLLCESASGGEKLGAGDLLVHAAASFFRSSHDSIVETSRTTIEHHTFRQKESSK